MRRNTPPLAILAVPWLTLAQLPFRLSIHSYVRYFVGRVDLLLGNGVVPIVVFDGCRLPMKADEEDNRRRCVGLPQIRY